MRPVHPEPDANLRAHNLARRLLQAARQLGSTLDPEEIYEALVRLLQETVPFDGLVVSSFDPATEEIRCQFAWVEGVRPDVASFPPLKLGPEDQGMQSRVIRTGLPHLFSDVEQRVRGKGTYYEVTPEGDSERIPTAPEPDEDYHCTRSAMMAPIILEGQVLGVVQLMCMQPTAYSHDDLELFEGMVLQLGAAARNAALYTRAQREVQERARAQSAIEELNRLLQRAMAETHHRVKNNLQVLAALVDMQLDESDESVPRKAVQRLLSQIQSLASLHDLLTMTAKECGAAETVPLGAAIEKLVTALRLSAGDRGIRYDGEEIDIPSRQATAFTLLLNELVSNALKHGRGEVAIALRSTDEWSGFERRSPRRAVLTVEDEGPGFPPDFDPHAARSTGMELVESLGRWDLNGWVSFETRAGGGARVVVTFPLVDR